MLKLLNRGTTDLEAERVGAEVAPIAWARLTVRQDLVQRAVARTGLAMQPWPPLRQLRRYIRLFLMCRAYRERSNRRFVSTKLLRSDSDRGQLGVVLRIHPNHVDDVEGAIALAKARGCTDDGHALAHIALSFLVCSGWEVHFPTESSGLLVDSLRRVYANLHRPAASDSQP